MQDIEYPSRTIGSSSLHAAAAAGRLQELQTLADDDSALRAAEKVRTVEMTEPGTARVVVRGCDGPGESCNGTYSRHGDETENGHPVYRMEGGPGVLYYRGRWKLNDSDEFGGWWYQAKSSTDNLLDCRFKPDAGAKGTPDLEFEGGGWEAEAVAALPSPLWLACDRGHIECVRLLLEKGSDTDVSNRSRQTPLFVACRSGHAECAQLLLERGADPNALDDNGRSPLMAACVGRHPEWHVHLVPTNLAVKITSTESDCAHSPAACLVAVSRFCSAEARTGTRVMRSRTSVRPPNSTAQCFWLCRTGTWERVKREHAVWRC